MARELILIPKKKYEELLSGNKNKDLHENNSQKNNNSQQNDNLPENKEKGTDKSTEGILNNNTDSSDTGVDMRGGKLYIKTTPTDFAKDLRVKPFKRKWLSFKI